MSKDEKNTRRKEIEDVKNGIALTPESRKAKWFKVFDLATLWVEECLETRSGGGIGIAQDAARTAIGILNNLGELKPDLQGNKQVIEIRWQESEPNDNNPECDQPVGQA